MPKAHIALVGGQPVPVYIGIEDDAQAQDVVLVCSRDSYVEAKRIKETLPARDISIEQCSPVDLHEIEDLAARLKEQFADYELTLNLTSGTKLWTLSFFRIFADAPAVRFIYVDQNNVITDIVCKTSHTAQIDTLTRIALYGTPLKSYRALNDYTQADFQAINVIEKLRQANSPEFRRLTTKEPSVPLTIQEDLYRETDDGSFLEWSPDKQAATMYIKHWKTGIPVEQNIACDHLEEILYNFSWFELKTAYALKECAHIRNIWLNCTFEYQQGNPKNEIDIIAEFGNRLLFVECKTMIHDTTDIDKFHSALRNFSGTSSMGLFVTNDRPSLRMKDNYQRAMEKCQDNNILFFNFAEVKERTLSDLIEARISSQNKR
ncbi:MAG: DUF1887 family protein [Bacteroidaceae bacterium]|nr:DUF1887 family protein [Bacteroidaceae bacterium]